eukprot:TRINITY_DN9924_c0_g1_i2.p1 TRINITY_DN9924_c0_g1~~TRINITY_DN9924_c0_g1_i2.p1  ORF type:complete len:709 (-),score=131.45 TRINITY_DN9924_c0_g1_i2:2330-4456(-)
MICRTHFAQYARISRTEEQGQKDVSFHAIVRRINSELKKGNSVIVDDENATDETRTSYIGGIRQEFPKVPVRVIHVNPLGGRIQCQWAFEWSMAAQCIKLDPSSREDTSVSQPSLEAQSPAKPMLLMGNPDTKHHAITDAMERWFGPKRSAIPSKSEGFDSIMLKDCPLTAPCGLTCRSLIIDVACLFRLEVVSSTTVQLRVRQEFAGAMAEYVKRHTSSRLIVLLDENVFFAALPADCEQAELLQARREAFVDELASLRVSVPVYYVIAEYGMSRGDFFRGAGMLAWAQRRHGLNLIEAVCVTDSTENAFAVSAIACGIRMLTWQQFAERVRVPDRLPDPAASYGFLREIVVIAPHKRESAGLPLRMKQDESMHAQEIAGPGRMHGAVFPTAFLHRTPSQPLTIASLAHSMAASMQPALVGASLAQHADADAAAQSMARAQLAAVKEINANPTQADVDMSVMAADKSRPLPSWMVGQKIPKKTRGKRGADGAADGGAAAADGLGAAVKRARGAARERKYAPLELSSVLPSADRIMNGQDLFEVARDLQLMLQSGGEEQQLVRRRSSAHKPKCTTTLAMRLTAVTPSRPSKQRAQYTPIKDLSGTHKSTLRIVTDDVLQRVLCHPSSDNRDTQHRKRPQLHARKQNPVPRVTRKHRQPQPQPQPQPLQRSHQRFVENAHWRLYLPSHSRLSNHLASALRAALQMTIWS